MSTDRETESNRCCGKAAVGRGAVPRIALPADPEIRTCVRLRCCNRLPLHAVRPDPRSWRDDCPKVRRFMGRGPDVD
jgi:hypothetical protein